MGLFTTIVITLSLALTASANPPTFFSVVDFGAARDGETDDSQAFLKAWRATCDAVTGSPTMIVPPRKTFLVKPVHFAGPSKSINLSFQLPHICRDALLWHLCVGSLGKGGANVAVEDIRVRYASFNGTTNGARIKTRQGATGYARKISFEHLNFTSVENLIIINQYYCESTTCKNQIFDLAANGAVGDGKTDDTKAKEAFLKTWDLFCAATGNPTFLIPSGKSFQVGAVELCGPCKSSNPHIQAFMKTWDLFCAGSGNPTFLISSGKLFQVGAVELRGPCKSSNHHIQLAGNIVAPNFLWRPTTETSSWIAINLVNGLTIDGRGSIDGRGRVWWDCKASKVKLTFWPC
ncbi:putative polygalacturonase [Acorus calamus]|uniref:Polygalacturonase n=1 Tax=Acorus calamus TaxID=4465 RepID=A0AAV9C3Y3_ACOCL|nr:putative polygalacturonase [Acorus calamus]